jgi:rhamnogalacturonyl hydrolase YesR
MNTTCRIALLVLVVNCHYVLAQDVDSPEQITTAIRRAFDWQVRHPSKATSRPAKNAAPAATTEPSGTEVSALSAAPRGWIHGSFLTGVMEAYRTTNDPTYLDYAWKWAEACEWQPGPRPKDPDDHVALQSYIDLYEIDPHRANLKPTIQTFDRLLTEKNKGADVYSWCDTLYMEPAAWTRLSKATGDPKYTQEMERLFWDSADLLFDTHERLFYRDKRFIPAADGFRPMRVVKGKKTTFVEQNGESMFWSRGNGWVLAGLARVLDDLPKNDPQRGKFEKLFKTLSARVLQLQPADGLWRMGLLDPDGYDHGEVSGSGFFVYGMAWGVRNGMLDDATYRPAISKGWRALSECQQPDGKVGYVQGVGNAPRGSVTANSIQEYGTAAFMLAGCEVMRLSKHD